MSDTLELKLQAVVNYLTWVLDDELRPSARAASIFNSQAISQVAILSVLITQK